MNFKILAVVLILIIIVGVIFFLIETNVIQIRFAGSSNTLTEDIEKTFGEPSENVEPPSVP